MPSNAPGPAHRHLLRTGKEPLGDGGTINPAIGWGDWLPMRAVKWKTYRSVAVLEAETLPQLL